MGLFSRRSDAEKLASAKLDPDSNATAARGLTAAQIVARQCKASDAKNKRRGK
jgi:hypothetical protein